MSDNFEHQKNPERVAAGFKGTVHNPNVSEEARENAREQLKERGRDPNEPSSNAQSGSYDNGDAHEHHVLGGYKATLKNPNVSDGAKQRAQEVLDEYNA